MWGLALYPDFVNMSIPLSEKCLRHLSSLSQQFVTLMDGKHLGTSAHYIMHVVDCRKYDKDIAKLVGNITRI